MKIQWHIGAVLLSFALTGCEATPQATAPGPFYVATAVQTGSDRFTMLPFGTLAEAEIPRVARTAYSSAVVQGEIFSDYTYDIQCIGTPDGYGYRYRSVLRQGMTVP